MYGSSETESGNQTEPVIRNNFTMRVSRLGASGFGLGQLKPNMTVAETVTIGGRRLADGLMKIFLPVALVIPIWNVMADIAAGLITKTIVEKAVMVGGTAMTKTVETAPDFVTNSPLVSALPQLPWA
jgi:hypothetical protein